MTALTGFLLARIAEDEGRARRAQADRVEWHVIANEAAKYGPDSGWHVLDHSPARVLMECEAKRRIVDLLSSTDHAEIHADAWTAMKWTARLLALSYADHPDYRDEWKA